MIDFDEKNLRFNFASALAARKMDSQGVGLPVGMMLVDFLVEEDDKKLLIEVKDPSHPQARSRQQTAFIKELESDGLINGKLVPKARDSYTYLHLMAEDNKPMVFVVVLGIDGLVKDPRALLLAFKERLLQRIRQESDQAWVRQYIRDCVVLTVGDWNTYFPQYTVSRL